MPVNPELMTILRCPACMRDYDEKERAVRGKLTVVDDAWLVCADCDRRYPITDHWPDMRIEEADKLRQPSAAQA